MKLKKADNMIILVCICKGTKVYQNAKSNNTLRAFNGIAPPGAEADNAAFIPNKCMFTTHHNYYYGPFDQFSASGQQSFASASTSALPFAFGEWKFIIATKKSEEEVQEQQAKNNHHRHRQNDTVNVNDNVNLDDVDEYDRYSVTFYLILTHPRLLTRKDYDRVEFVLGVVVSNSSMRHVLRDNEVTLGLIS